MAKTSQLLTSPLAGTLVAPIHDYSEEQQAQIKALREVRGIRLNVTRMILIDLEFQYATTLQLPEDDPYYPWELGFLDKPDTMPRYMRAAKWYLRLAQRLGEASINLSPRKFEDAKKRIEKTMEWRREFKPDLIPPEEVFGSNLSRASPVLNDYDAGSD